MPVPILAATVTALPAASVVRVDGDVNERTAGDLDAVIAGCGRRMVVDLRDADVSGAALAGVLQAAATRGQSVAVRAPRSVWDALAVADRAAA